MALWWKRQVAPVPYAYERAILDEISMLLDFVAGCPGKALRDLKVVKPDDNAAALCISAVLTELTRIETALNGNGGATPQPGDSSFLLLVRDALNTLIKPASGLTVAYTSMVVGNRRGDTVKSRAVLAERAYAGLSRSAWAHKWGQRVLIFFALLLTVAAVWDSAKVALGKSLLHNLQDLRVKQATIDQEKLRLEETFSQPNAPITPLFHLAGTNQRPPSELVVRLCDRPQLVAYRAAAPSLESNPTQWGGMPELFETAAEQDVCDRDKLLARSFLLAQQAIRSYMENWPAMAGTPFRFLALVAKAGGSQASPLVKIATDHVDDNDVEVLVVPVLLVLANYVLPVIFALLGAAAFVILDYYGKIRDSILAPRDHVLSWIRLVLGSVIGACIGLFFSSYGPQIQGNQADLIGALTLSASGISFLAGFGVEGVFAMLGNVVKRVFGGEPA